MDAGNGRIVVSLSEPEPGRRVATVTVDRAAKLNTLTTALMAEFVATVDALGRDDGLAAAVLTGAGERAFIGGANIDEMAQLDPATARDFITAIHRCCDALRRCPAPVIARIDGVTLGAGMEIAAACDIRVASDRSVFGMPEVKLGIPSVVEAALLPMLIGWGRTRELLLFGGTIAAADAAAWGFVQQLVPAAELDAAVDRYVGSLLSAGPLAVRSQKRLIGAWETLPVDDAIAAGIEAFVDSWRTDEPRQLMAAFLAKRRAG
jgi:enoyl-CoA hydratase/carnithine racemase